jgi:hypothetical protein
MKRRFSKETFLLLPAFFVLHPLFFVRMALIRILPGFFKMG